MLYYIHQYRVDKACELLLSSRESIKKLTKKVEYLDVSTFTRNFKICKGITPSEFRSINSIVTE